MTMFSRDRARKVFLLGLSLRFNFLEQHTPGSENDFVDVGSFSVVVTEVQKEVVSAATAEAAVVAAETVVPQSVHHQEEAPSRPRCSLT
jgi:hypothetical protein